MATWALLQTLFKPRSLVPAVRVPSIRHVDFAALKRAGYKGAVFDKDNCLTLPHKDRLVPQLQEAWKECIDTFGRSNVVIVSNASGTRSDSGGLEAESVAHHLGVPVLLHSVKKPGCSSTVADYFENKSPHLVAFPNHSMETSPGPSRSQPSPMQVDPPIQPSELVVVGDRISTDIVLGNRLGALSIWTTGLWERELMSVRYFEYCLVGIINMWDKFTSSSKWKRNQLQPSDVEGPKPPTPQELFIRTPPPLPPSTVVWIAGELGRLSIMLYQSTKAAASWIVMQWMQRRKQVATNHSEDTMNAAKPPVNNPLLLWMISVSRRGLSFVGSKLVKAIASGVLSLIRVNGVQDTIVRVHRLSSRFRTSLQRLRPFWPSFSSKSHGLKW